MHASVLDTWSYSPDGRRLAPVKVVGPMWSQIEAAIRRLDGRSSPILLLWASVEPDLHVVDEFSERLEVSGGAGVWWVAGTFGGYVQRQLFDPAAGPEEVELYPRHVEHGFAVPAS